MLYVQRCTHTYTRIHMHALRLCMQRCSRAQHYSLSAITYISDGSSGWSNIHPAHLHRKRKRESSSFFVHTLQYPRLGSRASPFLCYVISSNELCASLRSFEAFRGFVLLVCTRGRDYLYVASRSIYLVLEGTSQKLPRNYKNDKLVIVEKR